MTVQIQVMLETGETGDVLAGQYGRLRQLFQTDRARNAEPAQQKNAGSIQRPRVRTHVQIIRPELSAGALVMKGVEDPDQLLQRYQTLNIRRFPHQLSDSQGKVTFFGLF